MTVDGDMNAGKVPIQELPGGGGQQASTLIQSYNYYLQMIRDVTGLNEARDGSDPDPNALVGVQKLAAANSNTATRHILHSSMYLTTELAEAVSIRIKDVLEYHPQKEAFINAIGRFSVGALQELENLYLHDFGIFLELDPDADEKQLVESNIQAALSRDQIHLEDVIDIRQVKNIKLANQLLKYRRAKKEAQDQERAERNIAAQSQANAKAAEAAEMAKAQAEQIKAQSKIQIAEAQNNFDIKKLDREVEQKMQLMQLEFEYNIKLQEANSKGKKEFESSGNDVIGDIDMSAFEPK